MDQEDRDSKDDSKVCSYGKALEHLDWLSDRMSTQVRMISLGLLILAWGLLTGGAQGALAVPDAMRKQLIWGMLMCASVMLIDFLQYFFGYWNTDMLCKKMEKEKLSEAPFQYSSVSYIARRSCFWFKQVGLALTFAWFVWTIVPHLLCAN